MTWRNVELLMADALAREIAPQDSADMLFKYPFGRSLVLAVKHPPSMLYKLLFEPEKRLRLYISHPISRVRNDVDKRDEIDRFRSAIHKNFVAFEPLPIDERPLETALQRYQEDRPDPDYLMFSTGLNLREDLNRCNIEGIENLQRELDKHQVQLSSPQEITISVKKEDSEWQITNREQRWRYNVRRRDNELEFYDTSLRLRAEDRWPISPNSTLYSDLEEFPIEGLSPSEIYDILKKTDLGRNSDIDHNIEQRDYRLIDQIDYLVVYRPQYETGQPSTGIAGEVNYALQAAFKQVHFVHDFDKDGELKSPFTAEMAYRYDTSSDLIEALLENSKGGERIE